MLHQHHDIDPVSVHAANQGDLWVQDKALEHWYTCGTSTQISHPEWEGGGGKGKIHTKKDPQLVEVRAKCRVCKESLEFIRGGSS